MNRPPRKTDINPKLISFLSTGYAILGGCLHYRDTRVKCN
jgi:hypothetical protein